MGRVSFASVDALAISLVMLVLLFLSFWLERARISWVSESGVAMLMGMLMGLAIIVFGSREEADEDGFNDDLFFYGLLPPIILDAGFSMKKQKFLSNMTTILALAVLGTIISTFVTGGILHAIGMLPPAESYVFGALISATDPVSTLSVFKKLGAPELLFNLVFGESVLNDAVAIALYEIFLSIARNNVARNSEEFTLSMAVVAMRDLIGIGLASLFVGLLVTLPTSYLLKHPAMVGLRQHPSYEMGIVLLTSYAGYILATIMGFSGIITLFFAGLIVQHYHMHNVSASGRVAITHVLHMLAFLFENFIFVYLGISLFAYSGKFDWDVSFLIVIVPILCLARACHVFPLLYLANLGRRRPVPRSHLVPIWFAGLRGAIAFALALSYKGRHNERIQAATFFVVIVTTLGFGSATGPVLRRYGLLRGTDVVSAVDGQSDSDDDTEGGGLLDTSEAEGRNRSDSVDSTAAAQPPAHRPLSEMPYVDLKTALAQGHGVWHWFWVLGPCRPASGMRGMHGRWKRFDDHIMQPLFGAADDHRQDEPQEINIDEQEHGPRAWPRAKASSGARTRTSPRVRASGTKRAGATMSTSPGTAPSVAPPLSLPPVCEDVQAPAPAPLNSAPVQSCGAVGSEAEECAEVELSTQQSERQ